MVRSAEDVGESRSKLVQDSLSTVGDILALKLDTDGRSLVGLVEELLILGNNGDGVDAGDLSVDDLGGDKNGVDVGKVRLELNQLVNPVQDGSAAPYLLGNVEVEAGHL